MTEDNLCPECRIGEIRMFTKPNGNYFSCDTCSYTISMSYSARSKAK
jgi:hypothetical protein